MIATILTKKEAEKEKELTHREFSSKGGESRWAKIKSKKARSKIMAKVRAGNKDKKLIHK